MADTTPEVADALTEISAMPGHLLRRCQQIAVSMFLDECRDSGLTPVQFALLAALGGQDADGAIDQNRLGGLVALDRTTVSLVVGKLAERGLVDKRQSQTDRRARLVAITPRGRAVLDAVMPHVRDAQDRLLAPLDADERTQLVGLLARLADAGNAVSRAPLKT